MPTMRGNASSWVCCLTCRQLGCLHRIVALCLDQWGIIHGAGVGMGQAFVTRLECLADGRVGLNAGRLLDCSLGAGAHTCEDVCTRMAIRIGLVTISDSELTTTAIEKRGSGGSYRPRQCMQLTSRQLLGHLRLKAKLQAVLASTQ
jgi:hypothetical protein